MKAAASFQLSELVDQCERYLIGTVGLKDCVVLYAAAEELGTVKLKEHCSSLISAHWVSLKYLCCTYCNNVIALYLICLCIVQEDLTGEDFKEMPGSLLYKLLQTKSKYPLHAAVRLMREDVVFLYLVENNAEVSFLMAVKDYISCNKHWSNYIVEYIYIYLEFVQYLNMEILYNIKVHTYAMI